MTKIRTSNTTKGRPGFLSSRGTTPGRYTGAQVGKTVGGGVKRVRRLFARNPADGLLANIGTKRDVNPSTKVNQVAAPNPRVVKAPGAARATETHKNVVSRSKNRSIRKLR